VPTEFRLAPPHDFARRRPSESGNLNISQTLIWGAIVWQDSRGWYVGNWDGKMAEQKDNPEAQEKKEVRELRDLKPKKDVKGGGTRNHGHTDKRPPSREIDFMNWD
jgi:hypothetical protein